MSREEEDLIRWCYVVAGFSRARLARDFQCAIDDIEEIISCGLGRVLNPTSDADKRKPHKRESPPQTVTPKVEREQLHDIFRRALADL